MLSQQYWKFPEQTKEILVVDSVFRIGIGGWIGLFEFFRKNATKDVFLIILKSFHHSSFSDIPSKMYEDNFLELLS